MAGSDSRNKINSYLSKFNKQPFLSRLLANPLSVIILINVIVFMTIGLTNLFLDENITTWLALLGPFELWLKSPWGIITYMFTQSDFLHLLFNMMWLWAFGSIMQRFDGNSSFLITYMAGGVIAGLCFLVTSEINNFGPCMLIGASSSIMALIVGCAVRQPKLSLNLMIFGNVQLRWIALIALLLFGIAPGLGNVPTLVAHLSGALTGWLVIYIKMPHLFLEKWKFSSRAKTTNSLNVRLQEKRGLSNAEQKELDSLLERITNCGYKSLNMEQRARLFELSNKINTRK